MADAAVQGERMIQKPRDMQKTYECMGDVRGKGLMIGVESVKDRTTKERASEWRNKVVRRAFEKGLLLLGCGENTLRFCPPLIVAEEDVDLCLALFEEALREVTAG
jgi:4-aminobutyrate aminotransferase